jgi:hypothetical protein
MKKALVISGVVLWAFAFVFIACNDAYELTTTETEEIPSLPGPSNLKAINIEKGVITLTWVRCMMQQYMRVFRHTPEVKLSRAQNRLFSDGTNRYDDIISD